MNTKKRTISITALALLLAVALGLFGSASATTAASGAPVDAAGAKQIALTHAGLTEAQIYTDTFVYFRNGKTTHAYKFVFHTNTNHYVYIISADTGAIKLSQNSTKGTDTSLAVEAPPVESTESSSTTGSTSGENVVISGTGTGYIGSDTAVSAALTKAGAAAANVYEFEAKLETKNGISYYKLEIELFNGTKIKAEINAYSGEFISYETKVKNENKWQPNGVITAESALKSALTQAGISASDLLKVEVELDEEHGTWIYEVEFQTVGGAKYEYEINATTAAIMKIK